MDSSTLLQRLSEISIGSIIAVITTVSFICVGGWKIISKMIKLYDGYANIRDERDQLKQKVDENSDAIEDVRNQLAESMSEVKDQLNTIMAALDEQRGTKITELRHSITVTAEAALANGKMTVREYTSLHEMVDKYLHVYKQNWYVESLIKKVDRDVHVIGQLDEHGNDIE